MKEQPIQVLLVEDNEDDYVLTRKMLESIAADRYRIDWARSFAAGVEAMRRNGHDVCLLDHYLGSHTGLDFLAEARKADLAAPIILLTGQSTPDVDHEAMRAGAADYLVKDRIDPNQLERAIRYAIERSRGSQALRASEERYALAQRGTNDGLWDWDLNHGEIYYSPRWCAILGLKPGDVGSSPDEWMSRVHEQDLAGLRADLDAHLAGTTDHFENEHRMLHNDGEHRWVLSRGVARRDAAGKPHRMAGSHSDIDHRKKAEAKVAEMLVEVRRTRDDLLSTLNRLRIGSVVTDEEGRVSFVSEVCQEILGRRGVDGMHWRELFPQQAAELEQMVARPTAERTRVPARIEGRRGRGHWVDFEVHDDPRDPRRKLLFLYDVTEVNDLRRLLDDQGRFEELVGKSEPMVQVYELIRQISGVDSTVLISGETGTGKELVARAIHATSTRKDNRMIAVNCAGLTESLLQSQLFGHRRGAFTGAVEDHQGVFEAANGGTLFLDEIGDVSPSVQTSLLRVLEEREITRIGDSRPRKVDVRVIAATNRDLDLAVEKGEFRLDLLYRIRVVQVRLPALRERREDIPLLVDHFLAKLRAATGKPIQEVSHEALRVLMEQPWRGNVRELHSAIEFALIRSTGPVLKLKDLPPELLLPEARTSRPPRRAPEEERQRLLEALARGGGNRAAAARLMGLSRATFYRRLAELGIQPNAAATMTE